MKIIFISNRRGKTHTLTLSHWAKAVLSVCLIGLPLCAGTFVGVQIGSGKFGLLLEDSVDSLRAELESQRQTLLQSKLKSSREADALALKLAEIQARLIRLDALGERLTDMAGLDDGEFDFGRSPAQGGPEADLDAGAAPFDLNQMFAQLESQLENSDRQLKILESMMSDRGLSQESSIAGQPIRKGWISSGYGYRTDPFTGHRAWHNGIDFAGKAGSDVVAVAAGVVTWSGEYQGYGRMVEVDHGEGFVTRYAHNQENRVKVGALVKKGDTIARMGSSGRSTGPHVHFEVYKNGRPVDPAAYIQRTIH